MKSVTIRKASSKAQLGQMMKLTSAGTSVWEIAESSEEPVSCAPVFSGEVQQHSRPTMVTFLSLGNPNRYNQSCSDWAEVCSIHPELSSLQTLGLYLNSFSYTAQELEAGYIYICAAQRWISLAYCWHWILQSTMVKAWDTRCDLFPCQLHWNWLLKKEGSPWGIVPPPYPGSDKGCQQVIPAQNTYRWSELRSKLNIL